MQFPYRLLDWLNLAASNTTLAPLGISKLAPSPALCGLCPPKPVFDAFTVFSFYRADGRARSVIPPTRPFLSLPATGFDLVGGVADDVHHHASGPMTYRSCCACLTTHVPSQPPSGTCHSSLDTPHPAPRRRSRAVQIRTVPNRGSRSLPTRAHRRQHAGPEPTDTVYSPATPSRPPPGRRRILTSANPWF